MLFQENDSKEVNKINFSILCGNTYTGGNEKKRKKEKIESRKVIKVFILMIFKILNVDEDPHKITMKLK